MTKNFDLEGNAIVGKTGSGDYRQLRVDETGKLIAGTALAGELDELNNEDLKGYVVMGRSDAGDFLPIAVNNDGELLLVGGGSGGSDLGFGKINGVNASAPNDTLTLIAGTGIQIIPNPATKQIEFKLIEPIEIPIHGATHAGDGSDPIPVASPTVAGLMAAEDRVALSDVIVEQIVHEEQIMEINEELTDHIGNSGIHVTSSEKTLWNNKLNSSGGEMTGSIRRKYIAEAKNYINLWGTYISPRPVGALKIRLPKAFSQTSLIFEIKGFWLMEGKSSWTLTVSGQNNAGNADWRYVRAELKGEAPFKDVRVAYDGEYTCIVLGEVTTIWDYVGVYLDNLYATNGNVDGWESGYVFSLLSNLDSLSKTVKPVLDIIATQSYVQNAYNMMFGVGSPEGNITKPVGWLYMRSDGQPNATMYVKESGTGNVGWVAK